ncbi:hypothetical protein CK203_115643 [Vitis vinifera]|uniref:Retrotransposon gag domain-containing protein n=1 Tax=Vitis vinifera TaxID=29760 RepID=A0A438CEE4_VITVI|nr:hypothetical protein CK203_115643 [Vitis vinifera]
MPYWIRDSEGRLVKIKNPHETEWELEVEVMEAMPEDQHSQHAPKENLNAYRSMRDHMHPPRMERENPYQHIKEFEDVCNTFREGRASIDLMRLKLFTFTLKDKAKRYMETINACPHHSFDTWLLVSYFYDGMSSLMNQLLETMCRGDFMSKNLEEAMDFLSYVAEVSRGWDEPNAREVGRMNSQPDASNAKAGMYTLNEDTDTKAKFEAMAKRLEELEHLVEECPTMPAVREMFGDQANVIGKFKPNNNASYGNTYNSNLRNHLNFSWKPRVPQYMLPGQAPP